MKLKAGYKQTEVGVIPVDWEVRGVADFSKIITGPFGTLLKASEYTSGDGVPQISVGEIGDGYFRVNEHTSRIPEHVVKRLPQYLLRVGDVVFGRKGAVERSALVTKSESGWFLGSDGISVRPTDNCHPPYLAAQFRSRAVKTWLLNNAVGTTMPSLNQGVLGRVRVPFAPAAEQSAIANALDDVDALLAAQDALIAKKRAMKQGAMQELLTGKRRLPGFSGEWEVKQLHTVLRFQVGFPFSSSYFNRAGDGVRLVKNRDLKADDQVFHYSGGVGADFLVKNGDVLIGMDGDFLPCLWDKGEALLNQRVGRIVPSKHLDLTYAYYRLQEPLKAIEAITSSTTVKHLSHGDLEEIELPLPRVEEQAAIARVLSDIDAELTALETQRAKTTQLKQGMMQALLTGRIRLV